MIDLANPIDRSIFMGFAIVPVAKEAGVHRTCRHKSSMLCGVARSHAITNVAGKSHRS